MTLYSYVVCQDFGFAPNPFHGFCTLATCKPKIRERAQVDDWVVGTGSKMAGRHKNLVFAMCVSETMTYTEYWNDDRFKKKKPNLLGSEKQAYGDNIYFQDSDTGEWHQENSHHSRPNGTADADNLNHDTSADRVLIGVDFTYWGGEGPELPEAICDKIRKSGPGHKCRFEQQIVDEFIAWFRSIGEVGYAGKPKDW